MEYVPWPGAKVVRRVRLNSSHRPTGSVVLYDEHHRLRPPPAEVIIVRDDDLYRHSIREQPVPTMRYYTLYLDETGAEMADFDDFPLEDALEVAERGFGIKRDEWEVID